MRTTTTPAPRMERATDIWRKLGRPLDSLFNPKTVAVIGATEAEGSVGRTILQNLEQGGFEGAVYPVNPKRDQVLGIKTFSSVGAIPDRVDLAVIVTPA